jgi:hypothetical protein
VIDAEGEVQKSIDYDTFGFVITDTNTALTVPFGFAGGLYDPEHLGNAHEYIFYNIIKSWMSPKFSRDSFYGP